MEKLAAHVFLRPLLAASPPWGLAARICVTQRQQLAVGEAVGPPAAPWSSPPSSLLSLERAEHFTMSHPCSLAAWRNTGMHGGAAVAKAVVSHHSLTMVRPAAVMSHSMRPRYEITAVLEEYIMHAGSFSRFRYMLLRFELTAAISSNRSSDNDYCYHRPCEPVPGKECGKGAADTTGFENRERSVSRLIHCMYLRVNFGGIRRLITVVFVWLFGGMHETKSFVKCLVMQSGS